MPNVIKFSETDISNAIRKGNVNFGVNSIGYGPTSSTGYWMGIDPPVGGYSVYVNRDGIGPKIYTCANDSALISFINTLIEPTTNLFDNTVAGNFPHFGDAYNGNYGFGANTNIQQTSLTDNLGNYMTKVYRLASNYGSQIDYVYFDYGGYATAVSSGKSKTYSFDYFGTKGGALSFYSWAGGSFDGTYQSSIPPSYQGSASIQIPVTANQWQRVDVTLNNGYYGTGWMVLHSDLGSTTLGAGDYYLFKNIQLEMKKNPTRFVNGTRSGTFTTVAECINWTSVQPDIMILNRNFDNLVTDGLVLYLDASMINSYPKAGSIWYDLSSNKYQISIIGSPSSDTNSITFDAVNSGSRAQLSYSAGSPLFSLGTSFTTMTAICGRYNSGGWQYMYGFSDATSHLNLFQYTNITNYFYNDGPVIGDVGEPMLNIWHIYTLKVDAGYATLYRNNNIVSGPTYGNWVTPTSDFYIAQVPGYPNILSLGIIAFWNRALSETEILQNYNSVKGRFGL